MVRLCPACGGRMPAPKSRGRPRRWCSDRCRRQVWYWHRREEWKRLVLIIWKTKLPSPTSDAVIAKLEHQLDVVEWVKSFTRSVGDGSTAVSEQTDGTSTPGEELANEYPGKGTGNGW